MRVPILLLMLMFAQLLQAQEPYQFLYDEDTTSTMDALQVRFRLYNQTSKPLHFLSYTCNDAANIRYDRTYLQDGQLVQCRASLPMIIAVAPNSYFEWTARFIRTDAGRLKHPYNYDRFDFQLCVPKVPVVAGILSRPLPPMDTFLLDGTAIVHRTDPFPDVNAARPKLFDLVFRNMFPSGIVADSFSMVTGDTIHIRSGRIALSTVEGARTSTALPVRFPKGRFAIEWAIGQDIVSGESPMPYPAYARIRFSKEPVVRWALAVDTSFLLWNNGLPLNKRLPHGQWEEFASDLFVFGDFRDVRKLSPAAVAETFAGGEKPRVGSYLLGTRKIFFSSGQLSTQSAYLGYDKQGRLCCLLIDTGNYCFPPGWF